MKGKQACRLNAVCTAVCDDFLIVICQKHYAGSDLIWWYVMLS
jgi:hypothetical protein